MREFIGNNDTTFIVGPFVSNSDGLTPVTALTLSGADEKAIRKHGNITPVSISANSWAAITSMDGHYNLTLTNSQCDTFGPLRISIQDDSLILPFFEDVLLVNSSSWRAKYSTVPYATGDAISSLDVRVSSIDIRITSVQAQVTSVNAEVLILPTSATEYGWQNSLYNTIAALPNSATQYGWQASLDNHITSVDMRVSSLAIQANSNTIALATLPTSTTQFGWQNSLNNQISSVDVRASSIDARIQTLPSSQTLNALGITLPTSQTLRDQIVTLPTSLTLHAEILTLPTSQTLNAHILTLPSSSTQFGWQSSLNNQISSLDVRVQSIDAREQTLPNSQTLNAHIVTLPTSQTLNAHIVTLPTSTTQFGWQSSLNNQITSLDIRVQSVDARVQTLPNSQTLNAHIITLPVSATQFGWQSSLNNQISSLDVRVTSISVEVHSVFTGVSSLVLGAGGGGASQAQVQSACYQALDDINLNHLLKTAVANSSDLTAEVADYSIMALLLAAGGDASHFVSSSDALEALSDQGGAGGATPTQVQSACWQAIHDVNADDLITSADIYPLLANLPTSATQFGWQSSLNNQIGSLDLRVQSLDARIITLPTSSTQLGWQSSLNNQITSTDARVTSGFSTLPNSQTLNAHMITLPTSSTQLGWQSSLNNQITSADARVTSGFSVSPTSQTLNTFMATLPTSQTVYVMVSSLDVRVQSIDARIIMLPTSSTQFGWQSSLNNQVGSTDLRVSSIAIEVHSVYIAVSSLTVGGGATQSQVQSACFDALVGVNLDHLMKAPVANSSDITTEVSDFTVLSLLMAAGGDSSHFVSSSDSLEAQADAGSTGGATPTQVQSACYAVLEATNLNHLLRDPVANSSDLTAEVADYTILALTLARGGNTSNFVSSDDSLQGISEGAAGGGASPSEVQSACYLAVNSPFSTMPSSAQISTMPTSAVQYGWQTSLTAQVSSSDMRVASLDIRVTSLDIRVQGLPSSGDMAARISSVDMRISSLDVRVQSIDARIIVLPTSQYLAGQFATLPNSATAMPAISSLDVRVQSIGIYISSAFTTLPTSASLFAEFNTLPNSQAIFAMLGSLDTRVASLHTRVASVDIRVSSIASPSVADITSATFGFPIETGLTFLQSQREQQAYTLGIASGGGTNTVVFRDKANTKNRVSMVVDSAGNRSAVTLDGD